MFALLLVAIVCAVLGMLVPRPLWPEDEDDAAGEGGHEILVLSNPIHTDIAIPLNAETLGRFPFLAESGMPVTHPQARWLVFGWGGRAFYIGTPTWADLKPVPLIKGLTIDSSVIHADVAGDFIEPSDPVIRLKIGADGYARLLAFIEKSFRIEGGSIAAIPNTGYGPNDRFFEANGTFSAILGCNTWTAAALRQAGLRTGWWNPLPTSLTTSLTLYNRNGVILKSAIEAQVDQ